MKTARNSPLFTMLPNGKVLVSNGHDLATSAVGAPIQSIEIYDPATGTFTEAGNTLVARYGNRVTRLGNGQTIFVGGQTTPDPPVVTDSTESYNHLSGTFSAADSLIAGRRNFAQWSLPNGRILVAGGYDASGTVISSAELYTPWIGDPVDTTITSGPDAVTGSTSATFTFTSSPAGGTFKCSLDNALFAACTSPISYSSLLAGSHRFQVYATDSLGNVDPTPAIYNWTIGDIVPTSPANGETFDTCSYFTLPIFQWDLGKAFQKVELQFYTAANPTKPVKVKVKDPASTELQMRPATWMKILKLPGLSGGEINWKIVGTNKGLPAVESDVFTMSIAEPEPVDTPVITPTSQGGLPTLEWGNACGTKFKAYFSADDTFSKKKTFSFTDKNPIDEGGNYSRTLTSGQWRAIRKLVGDVPGTIYWYVESWDVIKRYEKTETMNFELVP